MSIRSWKIIDSEYVITNPWLTVRSDQCETDQGVVVDSYFVQESCDWVHVVGFNEQDEILLTRQYRHGAGEILFELPAGCVDPGESPLQTMQRELLEETGCVADEYRMLPPQSPNPARCSNLIHPFIARGVRQVTAPTQEPAENIESVFVSIPKVLKMIDAGEFKSALHIAAVYMALARIGFLQTS